MFELNHPKKSPIFDYYAPLGEDFIGLISIPHSGEEIPEVFKNFLSGVEKDYREDVDFKVNELVDIKKLQESGIAVLVAHIHRVCVDLNRSENQCVLFWKENTKGKKMVFKDPSEDEVKSFIASYHKPYFEILGSVLKELERLKSGKVSMIDLHSMPSKPTEYHMKQNPNQKSNREEFCLSDRRGKTCSAEFINFFSKELRDQSFTVAINDPYIGGYVTEFVDSFRTNNIQIEINRSLYMDEVEKKLIPQKVSYLREKLTDAIIKGFRSFNTNKL